jgi:hypothetical protein
LRLINATARLQPPEVDGPRPVAAGQRGTVGPNPSVSMPVRDHVDPPARSAAPNELTILLRG